jgi:hypothetical protein
VVAKEAALRLWSIFALAAAALSLALLVAVLKQEDTRPSAPAIFVWSVKAEEITHIRIALPPLNREQSWRIDKVGQWRFDDAESSAVDPERWGPGIPLLLSGPRATRPIAERMSVEEMDQYGFDTPGLTIDLKLADSHKVSVDVGHSTLDGRYVYIKLRDDGTIYTVPISWSDVLERLVLEPPYKIQ